MRTVNHISTGAAGLLTLLVCESMMIAYVFWLLGFRCFQIVARTIIQLTSFSYCSFLD